MSETASVDALREPPNYDEVSMQQSLLFSHSLEDLKNLRKQLYSAAEYFEFSYTNDDEKHVVVSTLKDYAIKALVNTVDHLGYVSYKVNGLLDDKVDEVSGAELRISCIHQRLQTCQEYIEHEGISQQSLQMNTPKYFKRYILPLGETVHQGVVAKSKLGGCMIQDKVEWDQFKNAIRAKMQESLLLTQVSKRVSQSTPPLKLAPKDGNLPFPSNKPSKDSGRTDASPRRFPFFRSSSLSIKASTPRASRSSTPNKSRPTTPDPSMHRQFYISEPRKSSSAQTSVGKGSPKHSGELSNKSRNLLKSLLLQRKSRRDDMLYTYLDEY